jgi:hypothetical protein
MAIYAEKKSGRPTGRFRVEVGLPGGKGRLRARCRSRAEAEEKEREFKVVRMEVVRVGPKTKAEMFNGLPDSLAESHYLIRQLQDEIDELKRCIGEMTMGDFRRRKLQSATKRNTPRT